ncbi:patatin-like phospholipase family protein [Malonomonas rubra]|nr:patatin-like phospholipase family protein [Malonomonas rubra]
MTNTEHSEQSFLAQQPIVPVLAGGGTRLPAHVGVIAALDELQVQFDHIVGVSGGSIVAALKACGKSIEEIYDLALDVDFRQFRGFSPYQLLFHGGLSSGASFEHWLDEQIAGARFGDLPINLHVVAMLIRSFMTTVSREFINDAYWHSTIIINAGEISPIEFGLSRDKKIGLYQEGYQTALQYVPAKFMKYGTKQKLVYER